MLYRVGGGKRWLPGQSGRQNKQKCENPRDHLDTRGFCFCA